MSAKQAVNDFVQEISERIREEAVSNALFQCTWKEGTAQRIAEKLARELEHELGECNV